MGWSSNEEEIKKGSDLPSKIIIAIIACLVLIILLILIILFVQINVHTLIVDKKNIENYDISKLTKKVENITYLNIEEFAKLVGYEYHEGEFKSYITEENKCYVQGKEETTSFFLNDNKIYKLPVEEFESEYRVVITKDPVIEIDGKMYATIETINLAFNTMVNEKENELSIYTLSYLVRIYDDNVKKWGYTGITDLKFENQKALLYDRLIVKKKDGLYKIINTKNTEEIVPDRYQNIEFQESNKEFNVTNNVGQIGIINMDGTIKIEPSYDNISILDEGVNLYLVESQDKFGIIKNGNITVVPLEYDQIGLENKGYFILDTLIPVCKNGKWGAIDKTGELIYKIEYDGFGCDATTVEIGNVKRSVKPVLFIEKCKGVVVKKDDKYGLLDIVGKELVPIEVSSIYEIEGVEDEKLKYFMLYNGTELNIIERLLKVGLIDDDDAEENTTNTIANNFTSEVSSNLVNGSTVDNINLIQNETNMINNVNVSV